MKSFKFNLFLYFIFYYSGVIYLFYFLNKRKQRILNYHHILPDGLIENNLIFSYTHGISSFRAQLAIISKRFTITTQFKKKNSAVITFDDGAVNNYTYALPILKEFNIKAYFFLIEKQLRNNDLLWVDKWFLWIVCIPYGKYNILEMEISILNDKDRMIAHQQLWGFLKKDYNRVKILEAMNQVYSFDNFREYVKKNEQRFTNLNEKEIELIKQAEHFIGSHSFNHDILSLQDKNILINELTNIKKSAVYNTNVFAAPFGTRDEIDNEKISIIVKQGFNIILLNQIETKHPVCFGRINLPNTLNKYEIEAHLSGLHYFIKTLHLFN